MTESSSSQEEKKSSSKKEKKKALWHRLLKPQGASAKWLVFLTLVAVFGMGVAGSFDVAEQYLGDSLFIFKVGTYHFTLYQALKSLLTIALVVWLAAIISEITEKRVGKMRRLRASNRALFIKIAHIFIYFVAFLLVLDVLGIDLTALTVFSGALGIGLGFGLQKIASNFISGLILLLEKSVEQDDLVELSDGTFGFVRRASARFTLVETFDGKEILIPNEDFITNRVINWTFSNTKGRVEIAMGVSYKSDIEKARDLMLEAASEHPRCLPDPEPKCYLRQFGDSSVNFILHFWVDNVIEGRWEPQSEVMFAVWKKFAENGIEIPFPQRDLHLKAPDVEQIRSVVTAAKTT